MSSSKSQKKPGVQGISTHIADGISSKVGTVSTSKIPANDTMLPKCALVDKELLSSVVNNVKSFKKIRKSSLALISMKKPAVLDIAFVAKSPKNGSHTNENKRVGKKIVPLENLKTRNSILKGKLERSSTRFLLSDGQSADLEDIDSENEENYSNYKLDKKLSHDLKKKKVIEGRQRNFSNLEKHENMLINAYRCGVSSEVKENHSNKSDKTRFNVLKKKQIIDSLHGHNSNFDDRKTTSANDWYASSDHETNDEFNVQSLQPERLEIVKMSEIVKSSSEKPSLKNHLIDSIYRSANKSTAIWHSHTRKSTSHRICYPSKWLGTPTRISGRKATGTFRRSERIAAVTFRRSARIAAMEKINYKL